MKKFISILKATMSGDMNIFAYQKQKIKNKKTKKIMLPILLGIFVMLIMFTYPYAMGEKLKEIGLTYIILTLFVIISVVVTFMEGVYKSQGILFDAKDNDMLFSMPIKNTSILFARMIKLLFYQYIYNILFIMPTFIAYAILEKPSVNYYIISLIMFILIPIIPTVIACIIGYIIKALSGIFGRIKKVLQLVLTIGATIFIFMLSFNMQIFMQQITINATNINEILTNLYYPVALYIDLINQFDIGKLLILLAINIIPAILFIYLFSILYFKIISKQSGVFSKSNYKLGNKKTKIKSKLSALIFKELKRYFSSVIYIFNTTFGVILMFIITIAMSINIEETAKIIAGGKVDINIIMLMLPKIFLGLIVFISSMTSITSASISLEGKSFEITKSLPISTKKILLAKVITSNIITIPLILLSSIIFITKFNVSLFDSTIILLVTFIMPTLIAIIGLIINLKYPMLNAKSDTVVVKQSTATMVSVLGGMIIAIILIIATIMLASIISVEYSIVIMMAIIIIATVLCFGILNTYGVKKFQMLNS